MAHRFEDLDVSRERTNSPGNTQDDLTMPQIEQQALADQIRRASKSICANLAEGFGNKANPKRIQALHSDGDRFCRRNACVDSILL